jgi:tRNA-Thr(GGU) m(6)t(6)A37 methyltransferase TsaA
VEPIGRVRTERSEAVDDDWGDVLSVIELEGFDEGALLGLAEFSHAEIIFVFDRVTEVERGSRHPRGNEAWPRVGIFAQRAKDRPNRIGSTIVEVVSVDGTKLTVRGLDAIDGTPVLDIKPVMREFLPRSEVHQPAWATELMTDYWYSGPSPKTAGPSG